ncbi:MAG: TraG family conjugative transposon ATPase, partial [Mucilaginibacter polytrichastri]|nr:TraG family conjugative transposon ATPase [Mucilaginibacter polytrichastri]
GASFLTRSSNLFFYERPYLHHTAYLYLTRTAGGAKPTSSLTSDLFRSHLVPKHVLRDLARQEFCALADQIMRLLEDSGFIGVERLRGEDLSGTEARSGILEDYLFLNANNEASPILGDVSLRTDLNVGGKPCAIFTLADPEHLPGMCGSRINHEGYSSDRSRFPVGFISPVGQLLRGDHLLNQYVFAGDAEKTIKKLEAKKLRLQSLSSYSRENAAGRDAVNAFLNEAVAQQRLPVRAHINVLAWAGDGKSLRELKNRIGSAMSRIDAVAKQETDGAAQIWYAGIPGNAGNFPMNDTFDTFAEQASCFFNLESHDRDSISPIGLRLGERLSGRPLHVDISDEPISKGLTTNRNKFILGPSGSGKSFFTNHMVRAYFEQGTHVVLVDVGHSYQGLCELAGGYYFSYSEQAPIRFNPFILQSGERPDSEKKESLKTLLLALWKKDDEPFRRSEYVALSNALTLYYRHLKRHPDIFPCFNTFYEFLMEDYLQILKDGDVREKDFDMGNFLYVLNPYYRGGEFDYLLNATEQLDLLNQPFIVFELDAIKDHPILFPAVTLIIMDVFITKMRQLHGIRKMILIEECWKAIAREGMAEYIKYLFKTVRKFFGEAVVVTQEVEDIISSPIVKQAIINNSDCKILLDQSKYQNRFDDIQSLLGLTQKEKAQILSMNRANEPGKKYKEVFISLGGQMSKVYRTEVSLQEYLCYTTEEKEKLRVKEYARQYGCLQRGIQVLASEIAAETRADN